MRIVIIAILAVFLATATARAATTIYVDSSDPAYAGFPDVSFSGGSLGPPDGNAAIVPTGGFIAYLVNPTFTTVDFDIELLGVTGAGSMRFYVGRTNGGTGFTTLNSRLFSVSNGTNTIASTALSNYCVSIGGCNAFVVQAWTATTFQLDSVPGVNPEPSTWALMILAFAGVAARMKKLRGRQPNRAALPAFS